MIFMIDFYNVDLLVTSILFKNILKNSYSCCLCKNSRLSRKKTLLSGL